MTTLHDPEQNHWSRALTIESVAKPFQRMMGNNGYKGHARCAPESSSVGEKLWP